MQANDCYILDARKWLLYFMEGNIRQSMHAAKLQFHFAKLQFHFAY